MHALGIEWAVANGADVLNLSLGGEGNGWGALQDVIDDAYAQGILVVASTTSGMTLLGVSGLGYIGGWPTIWEQIFVPLACAVCILFYGTKLHRVSIRQG